MLLTRPHPLPLLRYTIAPAVAQAASDSGVARVALDMDAYRSRLRQEQQAEAEAAMGPSWRAAKQLLGRPAATKG